jgi:RNA polymerase sigma factor (TIGR02999 family)
MTSPNPPQPQPAQPPLTQLLEAAARGDGSATDRILPLVYDELRRLAEGLMRQERPGQTLQPTALVHEAYLRLLGPANAGPAWQNRAHFFGAAAQAMRRILIDRARRVKARGGPRAALDEAALDATAGGGGRGVDVERDAGDLLALDEALQALRERDERQHDVVMLRYFAGLTIEQTAEMLGLSTGTVKNEWAYARAWLMRRVETARGGA